MVKNLPTVETWVQSLGQEEPLEKWLPIPVFLPEEFYGQRRLVVYIPSGLKESDTRVTFTLLFDLPFVSYLIEDHRCPTDFLSSLKSVPKLQYG